MFLWWKFVHIAGALAFLAAHGISAGVALKLRNERDPVRVMALADLSRAATNWLYASLGVLLLGGVVAAFEINAWSRGWTWTSLGILLAVWVAMYPLASEYYKKVRLVAGAMASGSRAVSEDELAGMLHSSRPFVLAAIGFGAIGGILYLMVFKPF